MINNVVIPPIGTPTLPTTTAPVVEREAGSGRQPTFTDVFAKIYGDTVELNRISAEDKIRLVLGETDDLEMIQLNKEKAALALELLVNVRNTVLESYNEIIRMQI